MPSFLKGQDFLSRRFTGPYRLKVLKKASDAGNRGSRVFRIGGAQFINEQRTNHPAASWAFHQIAHKGWLSSAAFRIASGIQFSAAPAGLSTMLRSAIASTIRSSLG